MKIMLIAPFFASTDEKLLNGFLGGSPEQALKLANFLSQSHKVKVVTLKIQGAESEEYYGGFDIKRVGRVDGKVRLNLREIKEAIAEYRPEVLFQFYVGSGMGERVLRMFPKIPELLNRKIYVRFGITDDIDDLSGFSGQILKKCTTILVNKSMVDEFEKKVPEGKYLVLENEADRSVFNAMSVREKIELRRKFDVPTDYFVVLFVGRFVKRKGVMELIKALLKIPSEFRMLGLFVGDDRAETLKGYQGYADQLRTLSARRPERFRTMGPFPHEAMPGIYNLADVFCLPSLSEGLSNALLEAEACGLDLLVSDLRENMRPGAEVIYNLGLQLETNYLERVGRFDNIT